MTKKITDYRVICSNDIHRLSKLISEWSAEGYEIYGDPFINHAKGEYSQEVCQAMIKQTEVISQANMNDFVGSLTFYSIDMDGSISIKEYLKRLLCQLWLDNDSFIVDKPFGNADWADSIYACLIKNKIIEGDIDEDGFLHNLEYPEQKKADILIMALINNF